MTKQATVVVLKPDALERELVQEIVSRITALHLTIAKHRKVRATNENLDMHFPNDIEWVRSMGERACNRIKNERKENPLDKFGTGESLAVGRLIVRGCREYYLSGPLIAIIFVGEDAIARVRSILGSAFPSRAEKGTIRGDFGVPEDPNSVAAARNLIHASDSEMDAEREMRAWFTEEEISDVNKRFFFSARSYEHPRAVFGEDGPCSCHCHDVVGMVHVAPCCAWSGVPRGEAEMAAIASSVGERVFSSCGCSTSDEDKKDET